MAKAGQRVKTTLECVDCRTSGLPGVSRYATMKSKRNTPARIEMKKYCKYEKKHTVHKETK